ncbi:L,D-transpeptidase [uncultured Alsobacter sp.]|uniref:L,D-transpeptidase n=1 Tax=uncultured Alsobacter sp. TaxID=1748258 RepID=UPI0025FA1673|nr:L,D-transpeptidase [uncultured Alsobacter sp.]
MISRRSIVIGLPALLGGCAGNDYRPSLVAPALPYIDPAYERMYAALPNERFPVPAVDLLDVNPDYLRKPVAYTGPERPGTIVVDPTNCYLYLVQQGGNAMRYGVGVGREGFGWNGSAQIKRKAEWPTWTPPGTMIQRQPELEIYANGMPPGPENPLGARAMYLYQGDRDTLYRIHGTIEPNTIGTRVSSGCIRLINQDVIDLYSRVPTGTRVVVLPDMVA